MIETYPDDSDIVELVSSMIPLTQTVNYYQRRGIFYVSDSREKIAPYCSRLLLGWADLEELRKKTESLRKNKRISGLILNTNSNVEDITSALREYSGASLNTRQNLKITNVNVLEDKSTEVTITYNTKDCGKIQLIRTDERECKFKLENKESYTQITMNHEKNEDHTMVLETIDLISKNLPEQEKILPEKINLERLTILQRIEFFDKMLQYEYRDWRLEDVISIKIRRGEDIKDQEIKEKDLRGIKEVVFNGDSLRGNSIVKRFEGNGYYFSGNTILLAHKKEPIKIEVELLFKVRPILPEIAIKKAFEIIEEKPERIPLDDSKQTEYLNLFWETMLGIYMGYLKEIFPEPREKTVDGGTVDGGTADQGTVSWS